MSSPVSATEREPHLEPLPPKWSEVHSASPIRAFEPEPIDQFGNTKRLTKQDLDNAVQAVAAKNCDHHVMTTSILGGEPLTVSRCMGCGTIDWKDLREQADKYARLYAARLLEETYGYFDYPDGSRAMQWVDGKWPMINIQQIYGLFTKDRQDGCDMGPAGEVATPTPSGMMPGPTDEEINSPEFQAIWSVIKTWDVNVPEFYHLYCGANGSHVKLILDALAEARK